jgi:hypothetical protein
LTSLSNRLEPQAEMLLTGKRLSWKKLVFINVQIFLTIYKVQVCHTIEVKILTEKADNGFMNLNNRLDDDSC